MKFRHLTLALGLSGLLAACDQIPLNPAKQETQSAAATINDTSAVLATVNGSPITDAVLTLYEEQIRARRQGNPAGIDRKAILEEVINLELARQSGEAQGLAKDTKLQLQIDQQRRAVIASAAIKHALEKNPVTDEEMQKIYREQVPSGSEYKARHILVKEQEEAKNLIAELDKGADFSELAKEHSTGPSGKNGGDLGWFGPNQMVAPFSAAAAALEKGAYTKEPVQTQFGWHVIILDDMRESSPPPFEQLKPQLQAFAQKQRMQAYIDGLRRNATIQMMEAAPAAATPEPAEPTGTTGAATGAE